MSATKKSKTSARNMEAASNHPTPSNWKAVRYPNGLKYKGLRVEQQVGWDKLHKLSVKFPHEIKPPFLLQYKIGPGAYATIQRLTNSAALVHGKNTATIVKTSAPLSYRMVKIAGDYYKDRSKHLSDDWRPQWRWRYFANDPNVRMLLNNWNKKTTHPQPNNRKPNNPPRPPWPTRPPPPPPPPPRPPQNLSSAWASLISKTPTRATAAPNSPRSPRSPPKTRATAAPNASPGKASPGKTKAIHVATYNVSNEAVGGKKIGSAHMLGRKCAAAGPVAQQTIDKLYGKHHANWSDMNKCFHNIVHTCANASYSFLGLQEVDSAVDQAVADALSAKFGDGRYRAIRHGYVSIVYDAGTFEALGTPYKASVQKTNGTRETGRHLLAQLFKYKGGTKPIVVINMHAPHDSYGLRANVMKALDYLYALCYTSKSVPKLERVIVMGDFNKEHLGSYDVGSLTFTPIVSAVANRPWTVFSVANQHKTAWNLTGSATSSANLRYAKSPDNIMLSGGTFTHGPETWNTRSAWRVLLPADPSPITTKNFPVLTSDHSPVAATLSFS